MNKEIKTAEEILHKHISKFDQHAPHEAILKAMEEYASQFSVSDKPNNEIGCPCLYLKEPCHPMCTCVHGESSIGCAYCCKYGSIEQRTKRAEILANKFVSDKQGEESANQKYKDGYKDGWNDRETEFYNSKVKI